MSDPFALSPGFAKNLFLLATDRPIAATTRTHTKPLTQRISIRFDVASCPWCYKTDLRHGRRSITPSELTLENASTNWQNPATVNSDAENRDPQKTRRTDERSTEPCFLPSDVARAIFGTDSSGITDFTEDSSRIEISKFQRHAIARSGLLPRIEFPKRSAIEAQGTEHVVRFLGLRVEKHQKSDAWHPMLTKDGKLGVGHALPTEYLRRLELQNSMFGDEIRVTALTRGDRFATTQPTLRGNEPSENEIRDVMESVGWRRIPIGLQELPIQLMGSAWWHDKEGLVLLDARKPNFKKTEFGVLPIDLILTDLSDEMRSRFEAESK